VSQTPVLGQYPSSTLKLAGNCCLPLEELIWNTLSLTVLLLRGNFYKYNTENDELGPQQLEGTVIKPGQYADICARGRQGSLDLVDTTTNARICTLSWNCSYDGSNNLEVENKSDNYRVTLGDWGSSGSLGTVLVGVS
jgi:hypothetical protein